MDYDLGLKAVAELKELFHTDNLSPYALRWVLMNDAVSVVIPGASKASQLVSNIQAAQLPPLTQEQMDGVQAIYDKYIRAPGAPQLVSRLFSKRRSLGDRFALTRSIGHQTKIFLAPVQFQLNGASNLTSHMAIQPTVTQTFNKAVELSLLQRRHRTDQNCRSFRHFRQSCGQFFICFLYFKNPFSALKNVRYLHNIFTRRNKWMVQLFEKVWQKDL